MTTDAWFGLALLAASTVPFMLAVLVMVVAEQCPWPMTVLLLLLGSAIAAASLLIGAWGAVILLAGWLW
jgi:hypothetical protein